MADTAQPVKMDKFDIEDAARTLVRAEQIKMDTKLHNAAIAHLKRKNAAEKAVIAKK